MSAFLFIAMILIGAILLYAAFIEPNWIRIRHVQISNSRLHATIGHLRAVHLSDLHINKIGYREKKAIKFANRLNPDMVFITGDLLVFKEGPEPVIEFLRKLRVKKGIWAVLGNIDYWNDHGSRTLYQKATIQKLKDVDTIHFLRNSHETISLSEAANQPHNLAHQSKDDNLLTIIGLDDPVTHKDDLAAAIDDIPEETPKILLTHNQSFTINPGISEQFKSIDLILSGHTHGGQVFIFKYLPSFVIRWYFKRKSDDKNHGPAKTSGNSVPSVFQGLHRQENTIGYVNPGLGTSYLPIRMGVRPEITLLEFVAP